MNADEFRKLALSLPETVESQHMSHPDFRVRGKIFASLGYPDARYAMVKLSPEVQERAMRVYPKIFTPAAGAWGRRGSTLILLKAAKSSVLAPVLVVAWRQTAPKTLAARLADAGQ